ncbi:ATP-grasp domain-containing protein [Bacillus clarus]|uniref:ATP-grasp domain protein n=1 Tax=Bacillus clarus TaxID=2338372 RepID=A0A090Y9W2_9BACI|nr:ATP-grasp domain-containing protein [Bacillus clarus]KFM95558.1 ATP-grasp domain protein [Bacillus clarus]RFT62876.1 ATP-grasp domain-containing protein [Bacillus clarus]
MTNKYICIVDAFSTGAELAPQFKAYGYKVIHVQSSENIISDLLNTFNSEDFDQTFVFRNDLNDLIKQIENINISHIIAGTETGVFLSDLLSEKLKLPGNNPDTSILRRNKYEMHEALKAHGIAHAKQGYFYNLEDAVSWANTQNIWPVVAKPLDSAGSDSVSFCFNTEELITACNLILNNKNKLGFDNKGVLIQECLDGQQYFVNAVTIDGQHVITEIWKDKRNQGICDIEELLPYDGEAQAEIIKYVREVLTCLGIEQGPSHTELMFTKRGPVLIECAARMMGTILESAVIASIGDSHVTTTVERYVEPEKFMKRLKNGYKLNKNLFCITLVSKESGIVTENHVMEKLKELNSFYEVFHTPKVGERIFETVDLFTNPGIIYLLHSDREQIQRDYEKIRRLEKQGEFFRVKSTV